jgi:hypothetical protein
MLYEAVFSRNWKPTPSMRSWWLGEANCCMTTSPLSSTWDFEPRHMEVLRQHWIEIAGHHQRLLEHAPADKLDRLCGAMKWIEMNLGPWPI